MIYVYQFLFLALWLFFLAWWLISARFVNKAKRNAPLFERIFEWFWAFAITAILNWPFARGSWLKANWLPNTPWSFFGGAAITAAGLAYAIWARVHLGRYWSATVVIKEDHRLIRTGPYAAVRHPIYTGILVAVAGTAVAQGQVRGLFMALFAYFILHFKARREEHLLTSEFGDEYAAYIREVPMLVPIPRHRSA